MASGVDLQEFVAGFIAEADEHLHLANRHLVSASEALGAGRSEPRAVRELFRSLHTIKGLASMVGAEPVVEVSHEMESLLRTADRRGGRLSDNELDLLLRGTRAIEERVRAIEKGGIEASPKAPVQLLEALAVANGTEVSPNEPSEHVISLADAIGQGLTASDREQMIQAAGQDQRVVLVEFRPSPELVTKGINITTVRERLATLGELIKVVPQTSSDAPTGISFSVLMTTDASNEALQEASGGSQTPIKEIEVHRSPQSLDILADQSGTDWMTEDRTSSIRVDIRRLDDAMERVSDLVVTRSKLARVASELKEQGADTRELNLILAEYARELKRLRAAITEARLVPLAELLQRIPLVVRGLTKDSSTKAVNVSIQVGSAEVDKAVADKIFPAIVHLVRNAVDHALETKEVRRAQGKPETGMLSIVCENDSGTNLVLTVKDDGRGIDRKAVAQKVGKDVARNDEELLQQIATPGLSTKNDVTQASGRGLGVDIVRRMIEVLGGSLSLSTQEGQGTTFTLRVPVSVTILDVLSFMSGGSVFVAPVAMIEEIIEVDTEGLVRPPTFGQGGAAPYLIQRRGQAIPLVGLNALLYSRSDDGGSRNALVVRHGRGSIAYGVDRMLGQQEVVVRPLDDALVRTIGTSGATDLGDGRPTLVLDLAALGNIVVQNKEQGL